MSFLVYSTREPEPWGPPYESLVDAISTAARLAWGAGDRPGVRIYERKLSDGVITPVLSLAYRHGLRMWHLHHEAAAMRGVAESQLYDYAETKSMDDLDPSSEFAPLDGPRGPRYRHREGTQAHAGSEGRDTDVDTEPRLLVQAGERVLIRCGQHVVEAEVAGEIMGVVHVRPFGKTTLVPVKFLCFPTMGDKG